jgi:hypothetical protein
MQIHLDTDLDLSFKSLYQLQDPLVELATFVTKKDIMHEIARRMLFIEEDQYQLRAAHRSPEIHKGLNN